MSEHTTQEIKAIEAIEKELLTLAHAETKRWQRTSILMMEVEQNELWSLKDNAKSFTQWVKALAQKAGVHESNFWRCLKAGRFYLKISKISEMPGSGENSDTGTVTSSGRDSVPGTDSEIPNTTNSGTTAGAETAIPKIENLPPLENAEIAPETLELVEKITTAAPPEKAREIVKSALNGELSRQELRETWQTYRPAKAGNSRGKGTQKPAIDETKQTACSLIHTLANDDKRQTIRKNLCGDTDYKLFSEVAVETGTTRNKRRIDAVLVANRGNRSHKSQSNKPYNRELQFIGVEIKVSKSDLINDQKYTEYAPFVHQLWLAVPPELVATAQETAPDYVGILSIGSGPEPTDLSCSTGPSKTPEKPDFVEIVKPAKPSGTGESGQAEQANNSLIYETAQTIIRHLVFR